MLYSLIFLLTSLLTFLIFTEIITVNIFYDGNAIIDINFKIFAVRYTKTQNRSKNKVSGRRRHIFPLQIAVFSYFSRLVEKSYIDVSELTLLQDSSSYSSSALKNGIFTSLISALIAYAKENAKKFSAHNITFSTSEHNSLRLNAKITISLIDFIVCTAPFAVDIAKSKLKRKGKLWQRIK